MLTQAQKVAIRRHMGIPFAGTAQAGRLYGWRFTWYNEDLEYRMNNMQPSEEQLITGNAVGSFRLDGRPKVGDTVTYGLTDGTNTFSVPYTVQSSDLTLPANLTNPADSSPLYSVALNSALALNSAFASGSTMYRAVGVMPADLISPQYLPPYFAEVMVTGPSANTFTLTHAQTSATTALSVEYQGTPSPIRVSLPDPVTGVSTAYYGYVSILDVLAMTRAQASLSLRYETADVVNFRRDEVGARRKQYMEYVLEMERVLGGHDYVEKFGGGSSGGATA